MVRNRILWIVVMIALTTAAVAPALAQDAPPGDNPVVTREQAETYIGEILQSILQAGNVILASLEGIAVGLFGGSAIALTLVAFIKRMLPLLPDVALVRWLRELESPQINLGVSVVLTALAFASAYLGYDVQFKSVIDFLTTLLPYLAGLITTILGAGQLFNFLAARQVPFFGFRRSVRSAPRAQAA
jgi:hypothetical protein